MLQGNIVLQNYTNFMEAVTWHNNMS